MPDDTTTSAAHQSTDGSPTREPSRTEQTLAELMLDVAVVSDSVPVDLPCDVARTARRIQSGELTVGQARAELLARYVDAPVDDPTEGPSAS